MVVVAMLFLFAAMGSGLLGLALGPYAPLAHLIEGVAALFGAVWGICLLFAVFLCAVNPRPPRGPAS